MRACGGGYYRAGIFRTGTVLETGRCASTSLPLRYALARSAAGRGRRNAPAPPRPSGQGRAWLSMTLSIARRQTGQKPPSVRVNMMQSAEER